MESKPWWQSKTIWMAFFSFLSQALPLTGVIPASTLTTVIGAATAVLAIVFRWTATTTLK